MIHFPVDLNSISALRISRNVPYPVDIMSALMYMPFILSFDAAFFIAERMSFSPV